MVLIRREIRAERWESEDAPLPQGCFKTFPEVHWSAGRKAIYFSYAKLQPRYWMEVEKRRPLPVEGSELPMLEGGISYDPRKAGIDEDPYWRKVYPFSFWSIKSEASVTRNHRAIILDYSDLSMLAQNEGVKELWPDYANLMEWKSPLPRFCEYRVISGQYGRGYAPIYMRPGDWLLFEQKGDMPVHVVSDEEFRQLKGEIA